jgi:hypothetical protein
MPAGARARPKPTPSLTPEHRAWFLRFALVPIGTKKGLDTAPASIRRVPERSNVLPSGVSAYHDENSMRAGGFEGDTLWIDPCVGQIEPSSQECGSVPLNMR